MRPLFVCSEAFPLAKTGGLGDVCGALPAALEALGEDVFVLMPAYPEALDTAVDTGEPMDLGDPLGVGAARLVPARMPESGVGLWLVDCPALYARPGGPYQAESGHDWHDNHLRFGLLNRVAAQVCVARGLAPWQPDVLHLHDWQAGLAPAYLAMWGGPRVPTVFTIHNLQHMGLFPRETLRSLLLPKDMFSLAGVEFHGWLSFLKTGLQFSDRITTVSPTYAREIQTAAGGLGFDGLLRARAADVSGILNGVDYRVWDPAHDPDIVRPYTVATLSDKAANKTALQREMGLDEDPNAPLMAVVSRMAGQKGLDLVLLVRHGFFDLGAQMVVLGSGEPALEDAFRTAATARPGRMAVRIGYDEGLAHRIQAGADMLLMPSEFEPCGLAQLYALRYGTVPVVRRTGGLADTVVDAVAEGGTGFLFDGPEAGAEALYKGGRRAIDVYRAPDHWQSIQKKGMEADFSWERAAREYRDLYRALVREREAEWTKQSSSG